MTTSPLEYRRPLSARLDRVREVFAPVGAAPTCTGDMYAAEDAVESALADLTAAFADPSAEDLTAAGVAFAKGKGLSKVKAALSAPTTTTPRFATIWRAAAETLTAAHDAPEFAPAALIAECADQARGFLEALAAEGARTVAALPTSTLDMLAAGRGRLSTLDSLDTRTMTVDDIVAHRDAAATWSHIYGVMGGQAAEVDAWRKMFRAVATGSLTGGHNLDLADHHGGKYAVWFDAPGCAALAAGYRVSQVITDGLGSLSPLLDPFGEDAEVYAHRCHAYVGVDDWAGQQPNVMAEAMRQNEPLLSVQGAVRRSFRGYNNVQRAGYSTPARALDAYLTDRPEFRADLDADDDR